MIYLIITTCINNKIGFGIQHAEHRKQTYLNCIKNTLKILPDSIKPVIVENNGQRSTYLDELSVPVLYTDNNFKHYNDKGLNELDDIKSVINHFNIKDEDIIIKLTGRYELLNDTFFNTIINNPDKDVFMKFFNVCTLEFMENDCVLGLYAIRCKLLKSFKYTQLCNCPEKEFAQYIRNQVDKDKIQSIEQMHLRCCFAYDLKIVDI